MRAPSLLLASLVLLPACGGGSSAPACVVLQPQHETAEDVVDLDFVNGFSTTEDVLVWRTQAVRDAPDTDLRLGFTWDCTPLDCPATVDCGPETLSAGEDIRCDLSAEADATCDFQCEVTIAVDWGDETVCQEVRTLDTLIGTQSVAIPGR